MTFRYHGNWCGPGWSDGRYTQSTYGDAEAVDEFDETCREHDFALVGGARDRAADAKFIRSNFGKGPKRTVAALAVAVRDQYQAMYDTPLKQNNKNIDFSSNSSSNFSRLDMTGKPNLRGAKQKQQKAAKGNDVQRAVPVSIATKRTSAKPVLSTTTTGVLVSHRSFLRPIDNSSLFSVTSVPCNPGLTGSFPWLSRVARRYEHYRFKKLRYEFRSVAPSSSSGVIMLSYDYDAADVAPTSKAIQAQTVPSTETNVWMNNTLVVRPDGAWRSIRAGALASNLDVKTYDMGNLWVSSLYGTNVIGGELYVEYTVELRNPTDGPETGGKFYANNTSFSVPFNATNTITGAAFPFVRFSNTEWTVVAGGEYMVVAETNGTGLTANIPLPTITSASAASTAFTLNSAVSAAQAVRTIKIRVETGDSITFANAGTGTTLLSTVYYVAPIDYTSH